MRHLCNRGEGERVCKNTSPLSSDASVATHEQAMRGGVEPAGRDAGGARAERRIESAAHRVERRADPRRTERMRPSREHGGAQARGRRSSTRARRRHTDMTGTMTGTQRLRKGHKHGGGAQARWRRRARAQRQPASSGTDAGTGMAAAGARGGSLSNDGRDRRHGTLVHPFLPSLLCVVYWRQQLLASLLSAFYTLRKHDLQCPVGQSIVCFRFAAGLRGV